MKMAISKDNVIGFGLALSSSAFIGASFIIKKKGLWKAGASGVRAGLCGHSYLFEPLWWFGLLLMIVGEIANFVAYAFAPAILVTPLGALSIMVSAVLAHFMLKERINKLGIMGCVMCIVGSVIIVIHAPQEHAITSIQEIWNMATQMGFLLYVVFVLVLVFILVLYFAPLCGNSNVLIFIGICSLMGSLSALDTFNTVVVSPIYYVMFTTLTILASVIMFKDWDGQDAGAIVTEICGFIVVISGTMLLQMTKDVMEKLPSFKGSGSFGPLSPTLTAGLYAGNAEFFKCDWNDEENPREGFLKAPDSNSQ